MESIDHKETHQTVRQPRILIVDDHTDNIDIMLTFLEAQGYDISIATSGEMALRGVKHNDPDLILLDIMMPGMDGYETCRRLKEDPATTDIPVIFVTAKKETNDIVEGFRCGGVDYISKPFRQEEVLSRVKTHLKLQQLIQSQEQLIEKLNQALAEIKTLQGIIPICSHCKKIRDDKGCWLRLEAYIEKHSDALFSHSICKDCLKELYGDEDWYIDLKKNNKI